MKTQPLASADRQSPDEIVAAIIAVQSYLSAEGQAAPADQAAESGWQAAAKLSVQSLQPTKLTTPPRWNTIERLRRGTSGLYGIVGL
ncbi:MAG TPA: hypothetical protein VFZ66_14540 [Herpetosiphonaceae bacterium]